MKTTITYLAPWLMAAAIGAAIALAPIASADTYHVSNHDEVNTTNGFVDTPF
jgi:hypothetical protein